MQQVSPLDVVPLLDVVLQAQQVLGLLPWELQQQEQLVWELQQQEQPLELLLQQEQPFRH